MKGSGPLLGDRILAGVVHIEDQNAFFEVWAYRKLSDVEMLRQWRIYRQQHPKKSIRGLTIRVVSNFGKALR